MPVLVAIAGGRDSPCRPEMFVHAPDLDPWPLARDFMEASLTALIVGGDGSGMKYAHVDTTAKLLARRLVVHGFPDATPDALKALSRPDLRWNYDELCRSTQAIRALQSDIVHLVLVLDGATLTERRMLATVFGLAWLACSPAPAARRVLGLPCEARFSVTSSRPAR